MIIVSPNILGTINATLLTVQAARARNIPIIGVILNRTPEVELGNAAAITNHGQVPILGQFPDAENTDDDDYLAKLADEHLNLDRILDSRGLTS